jgi:23S rRNA (pseudouridine1915-N3)-methyltransferase
MKIQLWSIGKPHETYVKEAVELFTIRISNYHNVEWKIIAMPKNAGIMEPAMQKIKEGETILSTLQKEDYLILLDETGKMLTSQQLAKFIEQRTVDSTKSLVFLIGGAYGVSEVVQKRANFTWSLSALVFPHQLVRLILAEQIYRACSIIKNEKYHHI